MDLIKDAVIEYDQLHKRGFLNRTTQALLKLIITYPGVDKMGGFRALSSKEILDSAAVQRLNQLVIGPRLSTYMYRIYEINAFTVPGSPVFGSAPGRVAMIPLAILPGVGVALTMLEQAINMSPPQPPTIQGGKMFISGLPAITVFASQRLTEVLTPDEQIAVFLHEIGHNTIIKRTMLVQITNMLSNMSRIFVLPTIILALATILQLRTVEYDADKFAAECGYGDALISALGKIKSYTMGTSSFRTSGFNVFEQILNTITFGMTIVGQMLAHVGLVGHPSFWQRTTALRGHSASGVPQMKQKPNLASRTFSQQQEDGLEKIDVVMAGIVNRVLVQLAPHA